LTKSQNKHNKIYANGEPLVEGHLEAVEKGDITPDYDVKNRAKRPCEEFEWEKDDALKIWGFGPDNTGPNVVVDMSKAMQYMNEIKDSVVSAWQGATKNGVLTEENMRGFRVNVTDCELHADAIHRGGGQILPCARGSSTLASFLQFPFCMNPSSCARLLLLWKLSVVCTRF
jgi:elongation factor 2